MHHEASGTWLAQESDAYPHGGQTRKGIARFPSGALRRVWAGIPDTFFTIPAHARIGGRYVAGYLHFDDDGVILFQPNRKDTSTC